MLHMTKQIPIGFCVLDIGNCLGVVLGQCDHYNRYENPTVFGDKLWDAVRLSRGVLGPRVALRALPVQPLPLHKERDIYNDPHNTRVSGMLHCKVLQSQLFCASFMAYSHCQGQLQELDQHNWKQWHWFLSYLTLCEHFCTLYKDPLVAVLFPCSVNKPLLF